MYAARNRILALLAVGRFDYYAAQAFHYWTELDQAVDLGHHGGLLRPASFKQLDNARQSTGDVLGLRGLPRDLGNDVTRGDTRVLLLLLRPGSDSAALFLPFVVVRNKQVRA